MNTMYKIYNPANDKFSIGGYNAKFTKNGKVWAQKGHLHNHFSFIKQRILTLYKDCEVWMINENGIVKEKFEIYYDNYLNS